MSSAHLAPVDEWHDRLQAVLDDADGPLRRVRVIRETGSTQDAARLLASVAGDVVVAWRQVAGRGRLGRGWEDPRAEGIAVTFVTGAAPAERLSLASAVGAAEAAEKVLGRPVGIKWPNDVVVSRRKLAGVLTEVADGRALIGVGMNVRQTDWPPELAGRAVSLAQLGARVDRLDVLVTLLRSMNTGLLLGEDDLVERFAVRDDLAGTEATFRCDNSTITGTVIRIDPLRGLLVRSSQGEVYLPAATTSVENQKP